MLLGAGATALLSFGTVAALDERLASGTLLLPHAVLGRGETIQVTGSWQRQLCQQLQSNFVIDTGTLVSVDRVVTGAAQKRSLFERTRAVAADRESAALAALARDAALPFLVLRSVADSANTTVPEWLGGVIDKQGRIRVASLLPKLLTRVDDWRRLAILGREFHRARTALRKVLSRVGYAGLIPPNDASILAAVAGP
jgi:hypothetical protein